MEKTKNEKNVKKTKNLKIRKIRKNTKTKILKHIYRVGQGKLVPFILFPSLISLVFPSFSCFDTRQDVKESSDNKLSRTKFLIKYMLKNSYRNRRTKS